MKRQVRPIIVKGAWAWQYFLYCWIVRTAWKLSGGKLEVRGLQHLPMTGPCLLIANHQSYLDPLLLNSIVPRMVHPMAKSTQFKGLLGFMMSHVYTFPVRRYQTDPQAARSVLRRLAAGHAIMIYIDRESTWDGRLQPFRRGVLKLIQRAGVPVIPVRIEGAYEAMPRWDKKVERGTVRIEFQKPLVIAANESIAAVGERLHSALAGPLDQG